MTLLNYWHYIAFLIVFIIFAGGVISSLKLEDKKAKFSMLISTLIVSIFLAVFSVFIVDKYTKEIKLYKLKNKRLLSIEKIVYSGIVKNVGKFPVGKVIVEIKLVNKGHAIGHMKGASYYQASGFFNFFTGGANYRFKPQTITKEFIVAKNLKAGDAKAFRVYFRFPPYFRNVSDFATVTGR